MKIAIVKSSELMAAGRWDAEFHILRKEYEDQAFALSKAISKEEAIAILTDESVFSTKFLAVLRPLVRGSSSILREPLVRAINEYPFLALAVVSDKAEDLIKQQQAEISRRIEALERVSNQLRRTQDRVLCATESVTKRMKNGEEISRQTDLPGLPALPDEQRALLADHRFVAGVVYLDGGELIIPVHTDAVAWVSDCWVIDIEDWTGPDVLDALIADGNVPVPRRYQDIGVPVGYVDLPDHEQNYSMGWRR